MIDFLSTRPTTDSQTAACARLLSAVIAQAIRDACTPPTKDEKQKQRNLNSRASSALRWLFDGESVFPLYANLIGSSAESIRTALLDKPEAGFGAKLAFSDEDRRILRTRARWRNTPGA